MKQELSGFIKYLKEIKHTSENTVISYERDLKKLVAFLNSQGITQLIPN